MDDQNESMTRGTARGLTPSTGSGADYPAQPSSTGRHGYAADETSTFESGERTTAIRSEIENTRAEMTETIDAIQDRLRPGNVVSRAAGSVREAAVEKVRQITGRGDDDMVPRRAADWYYGDGMIDRIRENPVAAGIAAASIAWLVFGKRPSRDYEGPPYSRSRGREYGTGGAEYASAGDGWRNQGSAGYGEAGAGSAGFYSGTGDDQSTGGADGATEAMSRARTTASDAASRMREAGSRAQNNMQRMTHENTLTVGAIAAVAGLAIGLALPETERENSLMGDARDTVVDKARDAARGAAERVQETAQEVQRVAASAITGTSKPSSTPAQGADNR
jgi:hypothetical protein